MKRMFVLFACIVLAGTALTACNTTKGFAKDLQKVGEKMEGAADRTGGTDG